MTTLRQALREYLELRRSVGFKLETAGHLLPKFIGYLERRGIGHITTELALAWAMLPRGKRRLWAVRLSIVRGFARFLHARDPRSQIPPLDLLPQGRWRATPYLYSPDEIAALIRAARALHPPLMAATYATIIGLLAATGMRRGEAIALDRQDLDWQRGLLLVRNSKFGKSRELPLHPSTLDALRAYQQIRDRLSPRSLTTSFFVSLAGKRLLRHLVHKMFRRLCRTVGIVPRGPHCRPRIHDLRHTFAIRTMLAWYRSGADVERKLPLLSTYLGHFDPASTYWYLSAAPELLSLAARRLQRAWEVRS
jgi:integrase/recombinase XerD